MSNFGTGSRNFYGQNKRKRKKNFKNACTHRAAHITNEVVGMLRIVFFPFFVCIGRCSARHARASLADDGNLANISMLRKKAEYRGIKRSTKTKKKKQTAEEKQKKPEEKRRLQRGKRQEVYIVLGGSNII